MSLHESNKSKLPNQLSDEELLSQLNTEDDVVIIDSPRDVLAFCSAFKILPGDTKVDKRVLCDLYKLWSKDPMEQRSFKEEMNKYFESAGSGYVYWLINQPSQTLGALVQEIKQKKKLYKVKSKKWQSHFKAFLDHYTFKNGKVWIEGDILYWLYEKWCFKTYKKMLMSKDQFYAFLSVNFKYGRRTNSKIRWFRVNSVLFNHVDADFIKDFRDKRKIRFGKKKKTEEHSKK